MTSVATLFGTVLIFVALSDIFNSLFHPLGTARLSRVLVRTLWKGFRRLGAYYSRALEFAGPIMLVAVIGGWIVLLVIGWALLYWPHLPSKFLLASGLDPETHSGFNDALYLSLTTLTTLGYGDITPTGKWLRVVTLLEAMVGFGILTVSLTWVVSIYQVLRRRRTLALEIALIREKMAGVGLSSVAQMDHMAAQQVFSELATGLNTVWNDLLQFPITYYFTSNNKRCELAASMSFLLQLANEGIGADCTPEVRLRASVLLGVIEVFATLLARSFLDLSSTTATEEVLEAYARDHQHAQY